MLAEQDQIPKEFRYFYILLPSTLLRDSDGDLDLDLDIPYLYFHGGRWALNFHCFDDSYSARDRFACSE